MLTITDKIEEALATSREARRGTQPDAVYYLLRNHGVSQSDATEVMRELFDSGVFSFPDVTHMELFLTEACNLDCTYCFVEGKNNKNRMTAQTARRAIDFLIATSGRTRRLNGVFFGGEPMLEYELIRDLAPYSRETADRSGKRIRWTMTTNGTLMTDERARFLAENDVHILISIDGEESVHDTYRRTMGNEGTFKDVMEGAACIRRYQRTLGAKITTMPEFANRVHTAVESLAASGVNYFLLGYASGTPWTVEQAEAWAGSMELVYEWWRSQPVSRRPRISTFEELFERGDPNTRHMYGCRAGRTGITVNCRGDIYACSKLLGADGLSGTLPLGTLDDGITETGTRMEMCGITPPDRPGCWGCQAQRQCQGGCYAVNFTTTGNPYMSGPECKMVTAFNRLRRFIFQREREDYARVSLDRTTFLPE